MIHSTWREKTGREVRSRPGPAQSKTKEKGKEKMLGRTLAYRYYMNKQIDARLVISGFDLHIAKSRQMYSSMKIQQSQNLRRFLLTNTLICR